jgi:DNA modification methylase
MIARIDQDDTLPLDQVVHGECLSVMRSFPDNSVDSIVCDPPAGISFMSRNWDSPNTWPLQNGGKRYTGSGNETNAVEGFAKGVNFDSSKRARDTFIVWLAEVMAEALRCLKPGGHALVWSLPRTSHWTGLALEQAGFEMRDCLYHTQAQDSAMAAFEASLTETQRDALARLIDSQEAPASVLHLFGSGFPKSTNISAMIDKHFHAEREVIGIKHVSKDLTRNGLKGDMLVLGSAASTDVNITAPSTDDAKKWVGWGNNLKPACENWWLCRKPLSEKTLAANCLKWGTGGLNIDKSRVGSEPRSTGTRNPHEISGVNGIYGKDYRTDRQQTYDANKPSKRFPSHVLFSHSLFCTDTVCDASCPVLALEQQSGVRKSVRSMRGDHSDIRGDNYNRSNGATIPGTDSMRGYQDTGTASRFFHCFTPDVPFLYCAKSSRSERNLGCEGLPQVSKQRPSPVTEICAKCEKWHSSSMGIINRPNSTCTCVEPVFEVHELKPYSNTHPTVKSQSLMKYLVSLITPDNGIVLDMFAGSGSTLCAAIAEGYHFIGIEQSDTPDEPYCTIARARIAHAMRGVP